MPLKVVPKKGSPFWYVRGTIGGVEIFQSTKKRSKTEAESYRIKLEGRLTEENDKYESGQKLLTTAIDAYIRNGGEERFLEKIRSRMGDVYLDDITQELLDDISREMFPTQKQSYVRRAFYDPILAVVNYSAKLRWCHKPVIERPKVHRSPPKWAEMEWFEAFWPHCSPQLKALTTFLPYTGCRVSEAVQLTWDRVDMKERWAYIPDTKTNTPRTVYLPDIVVKELKIMKGISPEGRVFTWKSKDQVRMAILRAVDRANKSRAKIGLDPIPYLSSHKLGSHTYATWMRRYGGLDQRGLVGTGRWKSIDSTMIYTHTIASEDAKKSDKLPIPKRAKSGK